MGQHVGKLLELMAYVTKGNIRSKMDDIAPCHSVLQSFFLKEAKHSFNWNIHHTHACQGSLIKQKVPVEDQKHVAMIFDHQNNQVCYP